MHQSPSSSDPVDRQDQVSSPADESLDGGPEERSRGKRARSHGFGRFDRAAISKGLKIFFGLSVASISVVVLFTDWGKTLEALSRIEPGYLIVALLLASADWFGGGVRLYVLTRGLSADVSLFTTTKAALSNTAMGAITPSQMGGGPAQVFLLYKNGLPLVEAMSASIMTFVLTMAFFVISAGAITFSGVNTSIADETVRQLFRYGFMVFLVFGTLFIVFIARPSWLRALLRRFFSLLSLFRKRHLLHPGSRANRIIESTSQIHEINVYYIRHRFPALVLSLLLTAGLF
ncbi:MAG: lysylphosphatidylglycerol synthase transmembrane domain-containing protein, partial [Candidatus Latescibacterota bacterium]